MIEFSSERTKLNPYKRLDYYNYFKNYQNPFYQITVNINIYNLIEYAKEKKVSLYQNLCYTCLKALNQIEAFKVRKIKNKFYRYKEIHMRAIVPFQNTSNYSIARVPYHDDLKRFLNSSTKAIASAKAELYLQEEAKHQNFVYFTSLPKIQFTSLSHLPEKDADSASPKISFGKIFRNDKNESFVPLSMQVNHRFIDGIPLQDAIMLIESYFSDYY